MEAATTGDLPGDVADSNFPSTDIGGERQPLLSGARRSRSRSRRRRPSVGPHGNATVTQAVLMVCRSSECS